ncbi:hypothetical protein FRX31_034572 [Thalictrum thalictroides]|uniref:Uncharacterized protein n=1 Tax=Thalictrum thalictroides TaxID=46969 RepID=A0A7J6UTP8_THATH|nr:hypothetical protein FRX31_034572 [Thalictrum thalictroides]
MGSWDDGNTILISQPSNKRAKAIDGGVIAALSGVHSQMVVVEKLLQMQLDSVPCKIRAKLDFTTHPRSIVERQFPVTTCHVQNFELKYVSEISMSESIQSVALVTDILSL